MTARTERFDIIIQDWLKSDNENTTYCAHLLAEEAEKENDELKEAILKLLSKRTISIGYNVALKELNAILNKY